MDAKKPRAKRAISIFLIVQVAFWLLCAAFNLFTSEAAPVKKVLLSALMMVNAGVFLALLLFVGKNKPLVFFLTIAFLLVNAAFIISGGISGWEYVMLAFIAVSLGVYLWFHVKRAYRFVKEKMQEIMDDHDGILNVWSHAARVI